MSKNNNNNENNISTNTIIVDAATVLPVRINPNSSNSNNNNNLLKSKVVLSHKNYNLSKYANSFLKQFEWKFQSNFQILVGQSEVVNWIRSKSVDNISLMRYGGEWKLPGGNKDDGETIEGAARRELSEEFDTIVPNNAVLRLFDVSSTDSVKGKSYRMYNFVCLADENPWLNDIDIQQLNKRLYEKRETFEKQHARNKDSPFWDMPIQKREEISPEVYQASWMNIEDVIDTYLNSRHAPDKFVPVNTYQKEQFQKYNITKRDPMYATMFTIRKLERAGTFDQIRQRSEKLLLKQQVEQEVQKQQPEEEVEEEEEVEVEMKKVKASL